MFRCGVPSVFVVCFCCDLSCPYCHNSYSYVSSSSSSSSSAASCVVWNSWMFGGVVFVLFACLSFLFLVFSRVLCVLWVLRPAPFPGGVRTLPRTEVQVDPCGAAGVRRSSRSQIARS